jgi:hypothetical protein
MIDDNFAAFTVTTEISRLNIEDALHELPFHLLLDFVALHHDCQGQFFIHML